MTEHQTAEDVLVVTERPAPETRTRPKKQPTYAVIVENDDFHTFAYVIAALSRICGHSLQKSHELAEEIHTRGKAVVWSGTLELAELKRDQIRGYGPDYFAPKPVTFPLGAYVETLA